MNISKLTYKNQTFFWFVMLAIVVGGVASFFKIGKLEDPEIQIMNAVVVTLYPGASAEEVEQQVTAVLESEIRTMEDVEVVRSTSTANVSQVSVTLSFGVTGDKLQQNWDMLRRKVDAATSKLPSGAAKPMVMDDIGELYGMFYAMTGDGYSYQEMNRYAQFIKNELQLLPGVRRVEINGYQKPVISVEIANDKMAQLGLFPIQLLMAIDGQGSTVYAGNFETGDERLRLTVDDRFEKIKDVENLLIQSLDGTQIRLGDIAKVYSSTGEPERFKFKYNNKDALGISISMQSGHNIIEVGKEVEQRMAELREEIPVGFEFDKVFFQPDRVDGAINSFLWNLVMSVVIVVVVLMFIMGFRNGVIIGLGLLLTILATFPILYATGGMLQRISLGAFIVAMGMLVDNAIVVIDGITVAIQKGIPLKRALFDTPQKTAAALLGATLIAIVAFLPVFLSPDVTGEYIGDLFVVLAVSLLISWVLALTQVPIFVKTFVDIRKLARRQEDPFSGKVFDKFRRFLDYVLRHKTATIGGTIALMAIAMGLFKFVTISFLPDFSYNQVYIEYTLPDGTTPDRVNKDLEEITNRLLEYEEVESVTTSHGMTPSRYCLARAFNQGGDNYGELIINFKDYATMEKMKPVFEEFLRRDYTDAYVRLRKFNLSVASSHSIEAEFTGPDPEVLRRLSSEAKAIMKAEPLVDAYTVSDDWAPMGKAVYAKFAQEEARRNGTTRSDVGMALLAATDGLPVGKLYDEGEPLDIVFKTRDADGGRTLDLENVAVWNMFPNINSVDPKTVYGLLNGSSSTEDIQKELVSSVPMSQVTDGVEMRWENTVIQRYNGKRTIQVQCDPNDDNTPADTRKAILKKIENIQLPDGYTLKWIGEYDLQEKAMVNIYRYLPVAGVVIVLILILLFKDIKKPLIILLCLPIVVIGIVPGLIIFNQPLAFVAIVGMIGLAGMMIKSSIVLIDETDRLIAVDKMNPHDAVIEATISRTKPVSMAAVTTILGMLPLIPDPMYGPLAVTIIAGLIIGTIITLILVPVLYSMFFKVKSGDGQVMGDKKGVEENRKRGFMGKTFVVFVMSIVCVSSLSAQEQLSIERCRTLALENSKDIKIAEQQEIQAKAMKQSMIANYFPKASATGGLMYMFNDVKLLENIDPLLPQFDVSGGQLPPAISDIVNPLLGDLRKYIVDNWSPIELGFKGAFMAGITVQQPVYTGGRILAGNRMAKLGMEMAAENKLLQQQNALLEADQIYWLYVSVGEKVKLAKEYKSLLDTAYSKVEDAVNYQMATRNDLLKVQVKRNQVELEMQRAIDGRELARMALCRVVGFDLETPIVATDSVFVENNVSSLEVLGATSLPQGLGDILQNRLEYSLLQKQIEMKRQNRRLVMGEYLPTIGVGGMWGYMGGYQIQGVGQKAINISNIMATVNIPILGWAEGSKKIKAARTEENIAQLELEKNSELMQLEIKKAMQDMNNAQRRIVLAKETLLQADESLRVSTDMYDVGMETVVNLLEAQAQWQEIYSELIDAETDYRIKQTVYKKAINELLPATY